VAERENTYPDGSYPSWTDYDWAQGPGEHGVTQPAAGLRQVGYDDDEIPTNDNWNDILQRFGNGLRYLGIVVPREFSALAEAINEVTDSFIFRIHAPVGGWNDRGGTCFTTEGTGGATPVLALATDGQRIYYGQTDYVYATDPESLTDEWSYQPSSGKNIIDLAADGLNVYALIGAQDPGDEVFLLTPSTGAKRDSASIVAPDCTCLDANGVYLVVAQGSTVHFYNGVASTLNKTGTFANTQTVVRLAIGNKRVYTVATGATGYPVVRAVNLSTRTEDWNNQTWFSTVLSANADPYWICTDGDFVYVVLDRTALVAGGDVNVACFNAETGEMVWLGDVPTSALATDMKVCTVDDRYLWLLDVNPDGFCLDKHTGQLLFSFTGFDIRGCDGLSCVGYSANNVKRIWRGGPSRLFLRTNSTDDNRRPFFNLAVPISEGI